MRQPDSQGRRRSGLSLRERGVSGAAQGVADSLREPARDEYRRTGRQDRESTGGHGHGEGFLGPLSPEIGEGGRAGTHGGKISAESSRRNRSQQEEQSLAADLRAGHALRRRTHRRTAGRALRFARKNRGGLGRAVDRGARNRAEGGGQHRGVFLGESEPRFNQAPARRGPENEGRAAGAARHATSR